jgi:hypothetical protein
MQVTNPANLSGLGGAVLGVIALALPFTASISPLEALRLGADLWAKMLAGSALLSIPIAAWQLRGLSASTRSPLEIALAYVLSSAAMLPALAMSAQTAWGWWGEPEEAIGCAGLVACWGLAACSGALLVRNIRHRVVSQATAEMFLLGGYLPNAVFALLLFFPFYGGPGKDPDRLRHLFIFSGWDVGAYVVLATCITFVVKIVVLLKPPESFPPQQGAAEAAPHLARR